MKDILLAIVVLIIFVAVFLSKGKNIVYQPLQPQTIFDAESSTISARQDKVVSFVPQVAGSQQPLPNFKIYTELYVPEKFVANIVKTKSAADYILVNEQLLQQKVIFQPTITQQVAEKQTQQITNTTQIVKSEKQSRNLRDKQQTEQKTNETTKKSEKSVQQKINVLNYQNIQNYVKQNPKTYFYPNLQTGKDVVLSCVSFTPYENKQGILKFSIENKQKSFFFINSFSVETQDGQKLPIQVFAEQFVAPEESITGYIVFQVEPKKNYILTISAKNTLKIQFSTPGGI
jgi:hypothetical protein